MKRRISTFVEFEWNGSRYVTVPETEQGFDYEGPVEEAKKGRDTQDAAAKAAQDKAKHDQEVQDAARAKADPFASSLLSNGKDMSPYLKAQYAAKVRQIHGTYGNAMRVGLRQLGQRGLAQAPTGAESSLINTANNGEAGADTDAYASGMADTLGTGLEGLKYYQGQQVNYDPTKDLSLMSDAAYKRSQMGSTMGDIGSGLSTAAGIFSGVGSGMHNLGYA